MTPKDITNKDTSMKKATMRIPTQMETRKSWISSYGGHYNTIVVFSQKPKKGKKGRWDEGEYNIFANQEIIAGSFDQEQFNQWFGTNITPTDTEIKEVEQYELTTLWDQYNRIVGLQTNYDN